VTRVLDWLESVGLPKASAALILALGIAIGYTWSQVQSVHEVLLDHEGRIGTVAAMKEQLAVLRDDYLRLEEQVGENTVLLAVTDERVRTGRGASTRSLESGN